MAEPLISVEASLRFKLETATERCNDAERENAELREKLRTMEYDLRVAREHRDMHANICVRQGVMLAERMEHNTELANALRAVLSFIEMRRKELGTVSPEMEALESQVKAAVDTIPVATKVTLPVVSEVVMRCLKDACDLAMNNTVAARIPECGDFGRIAQDLSYAIDNLTTPTGPVATIIDCYTIEQGKDFVWGQGIFSCTEEIPAGSKMMIIPTETKNNGS